MAVSFGELSGVLVESRHADDTVLALAKLECGRELTDADLAALESARNFLKDVKGGSTWLSHEEMKHMDSDSTRFFSSLVRAADSMPSTPSMESFGHQIDSLLTTAEKLASGTKVSIEEVQHLRKFFNGVLTRSLDQIDSMFAPAPFPRANVA